MQIPPSPFVLATAEDLDRWWSIRGHNQPLRRPYENFQGFNNIVNPGQRGQLLRMTGISEALGRIDPTLVTVHLSAEPLPTADAIPIGTNSRALVELNWGCGGASHKAIADVGRGTQIQFCADALDLAAVYQGPVDGSTPIGPQLLFSATVVYGGRSSPGEGAPAVTFTDGPFSLSEASPLIGQIPPFAKSATLLLSNPAPLRTGAWTLTLAAARDLGFVSPASIVIGAPEYPQRYALAWPLVPEANFLAARVVGAGVSQAWIVYELAL